VIAHPPPIQDLLLVDDVLALKVKTAVTRNQRGRAAGRNQNVVAHPPIQDLLLVDDALALKVKTVVTRNQRGRGRRNRNVIAHLRDPNLGIASGDLLREVKTVVTRNPRNTGTMTRNRRKDVPRTRQRSRDVIAPPPPIQDLLLVDDALALKVQTVVTRNKRGREGRKPDGVVRLRGRNLGIASGDLLQEVKTAVMGNPPRNRDQMTTKRDRRKGVPKTKQSAAVPLPHLPLANQNEDVPRTSQNAVVRLRHLQLANDVLVVAVEDLVRAATVEVLPDHHQEVGQGPFHVLVPEVALVKKGNRTRLVQSH